MAHRRTKGHKRSGMKGVLVFLSALCMAGSSFAADHYWVVGGAGDNYYFVPVVGAQFPNDHAATLTVCDLSQNDFNPQSNAPMTLNPTTGTEAGNRLPPAGSSIAFTPTSDQAKAGEAKVMLTFDRDQTDPAGTLPKKFITVDKWVVVGITFNKDPVTVGIGANRTSETPAYPATNPATYPHRLTATVKPIAGKGHVSFDTTNAQRATVQAGTFTDDQQANTSTATLTVTGVNATPSNSPNGDADVRGKVDTAVGKTIKVIVIKPDAIATPHQEADSDVTPVNLCNNNTTSPASPQFAIYPNVHLETNWIQWLTITVNDQFGNTLGSIYGGAEVGEYGLVNINQKMTSGGTYTDPVFYRRYLLEGATVDKDSQSALDWPEQDPLEMANDSFQVQNISVQVDGINLTEGIVNRTLEWTRPNHIEVTWPDQ